MNKDVRQAACTHWSESTYKTDAEDAFYERDCLSVTAMTRHSVLRAFEKGAEWANSHPKSPWISVKEQLPDNDDDLYIVLDTTLSPPVCGVCEFDLFSNKWVSQYGIIIYPTHWMLIPKFD